MTYQKILVFGLEELESREILELLSSIEILDEVKVRSSRESIRPGVIFASAEYVEFILKFVTESVAKEIVKYAAEEGWNAIKIRILDWKDARNEESGRERIHLAFGGDGELIIDPKKDRLR